MSDYKLGKTGEKIATFLGWLLMIAAAIFVVALLVRGIAWLWGL